MVNGILDYFKLSGRENIVRVDFNKVIKEVSDFISISIYSKNAKINSILLPSIYANKIQILQLFKNLIEKAIKYNESKEPTINIDYSDDIDNYMINVNDNGIGVDAEFKVKAHPG